MEKKNIEIVQGDGKELEISPAYDHLSSEKPKKQQPKDIVIPENTKKDKN